ncbi:MAG: hypothetical protein HQL27_09170 [Candidatus Omnitrophica bacterium]|nr:hypothetical protein [Candidatus Omnitrophota bacterium]
MKKSLLMLGIFVFAGWISAVVYAEHKGLKKTVAVYDFSNDSGYSSQGDLGKDFSVQLQDALIQSGQFIVLTRKDLDVVMAEQDLAQSNRMAKSTTAQTGKIVPAQILIKGQITEFQENTSGGGQGISIKGFSIGAQKSSAHMAVIVQLVDSTTGEIIESKRVEGEAASGGLSLGYSGDIGINSSNFKKTPLGKAAQMAIDRAVDYIAKKMNEIPWKGKVIQVKEDGMIYINSGSNANVKVGDKFEIYREGEALVDPDTGMELGKETAKIGEVSIAEVQEKFSKGKAAGSGQGNFAKGDLVQEK